MQNTSNFVGINNSNDVSTLNRASTRSTSRGTTGSNTSRGSTSSYTSKPPFFTSLGPKNRKPRYSASYLAGLRREYTQHLPPPLIHAPPPPPPPLPPPPPPHTHSYPRFSSSFDPHRTWGDSDFKLGSVQTVNVRTGKVIPNSNKSGNSKTNSKGGGKRTRKRKNRK